MSLRAFLTASTTVVALVAAPAVAPAAERWAAPDGDGAAPCLQTDPCALADALTGVLPMDQVIVTTGSSDYAVTGPLRVPAWVTLRAADADDRPRLVADAGLTGPVVQLDGDHATAAGLEIVGVHTAAVPLDLAAGAIGAQLVLRSAGTSARVAGAGAVLRDTLATSTGTAGTASAVTVRDGTTAAPVQLTNVTALAESGAARAVRCGPGTTEITNSILRGATADLLDTSTTCAVAHSAYRTQTAPATVIDGGGNISADPVFATPGIPARTSPTVDAGATDGTEADRRDIAGADRVQGGKIDMGAAETTVPAATPDPIVPVTTAEEPKTPAGSPLPPATPTATTQSDAGAAPTADTPAVTLPPATTPDLGKTVNLEAAAGTVRVKLPGTDRYVDLSDASTLPVGTIVDTNDGSVTLTTDLPGGQTQSGTFGGGKFSVSQPANESGMTDIVLRGGWFQACIPAGESAPVAKRKAVPTARAATAAGRKRKPVRSLWSKDRGGKFRTHGKTSITTVRGTSWVTEDRCEGTVTRVTDGAVDVKARRSGKVTRVKAGQSLLVKRLPRPKAR